MLYPGYSRTQICEVCAPLAFLVCPLNQVQFISPAILSAAPGTFPSPPLLLTIFMGNFRAFFSFVVWCFLFECCVCWIGLPRFSWLWNSLWLICLSGIELLEIVVIWFSCLFSGTGLLCYLLLRHLCLPNRTNHLLCILTQRHHVVMCMLAFRLPWFFDWHNMCLAFLGIGYCFFSPSGIAHWGRLLVICSVCNTLPVNIPPFGHFVKLLPHLPVVASWLGLPWVILDSWIPLLLVSVMWHAPILLQINLDLIWFLLLLNTYFRPPFLSGNTARSQSMQGLGLFLLLWEHALYNRPSIVVFRLHLFVMTNLFYRISTPVSILSSPSEQSIVRIASMLTWACPSFLLSLLIVNLYAQLHDATSYCDCWHLIIAQFGWDEVKGVCPFVYEDTLSETSHCNFLFFGLASIRLLCCHFVLLLIQNTWAEHNRLGILLFAAILAMDWLSTLGRLLGQLTSFACCCITGLLPHYMLKHDLPMQVYHGALEPARVYSAMYWIYLITLYYWSSILSPVVPRLLVSLNYLIPNCKFWLVWVVVQCGYVIGLCPTALAQHRRMLRLASRGFACNRPLIPPFTIQATVMSKTGFLTSLKRLQLPNRRFLPTLVTL